MKFTDYEIESILITLDVLLKNPQLYSFYDKETISFLDEYIPIAISNLKAEPLELTNNTIKTMSIVCQISSKIHDCEIECDLDTYNLFVCHDYYLDCISNKIMKL